MIQDAINKTIGAIAGVNAVKKVTNNVKPSKSDNKANVPKSNIELLKELGVSGINPKLLSEEAAGNILSQSKLEEEKMKAIKSNIELSISKKDITEKVNKKRESLKTFKQRNVPIGITNAIKIMENLKNENSDIEVGQNAILKLLGVKEN